MTTAADIDLVRLGRRCWGTLEPVHALGYFAPETSQAYVDLGLHPRLSYFAARSAAFGAVDPAVTIANFYVFAPWLVERALPSAWKIASPEQIQLARRDGVASALRRTFGEPDVSEALALAREACDGLSPHGRPLYAAHSTLTWPEDELLALWHAATLIREHRGDGHVSVLQASGLDPVESLVLGGVFSGNTDFVRTTRGWSDGEWTAAEARMRSQGLLTGEGQLTGAGSELRQDVEDRTDALAAEGWARLGSDGCRRLLELAGPLRTMALAAGDLPDWFTSRG